MNDKLLNIVAEKLEQVQKELRFTPTTRVHSVTAHLEQDYDTNPDNMGIELADNKKFKEDYKNVNVCFVGIFITAEVYINTKYLCTSFSLRTPGLWGIPFTSYPKGPSNADKESYREIALEEIDTLADMLTALNVQFDKQQLIDQALKNFIND